LLSSWKVPFEAVDVEARPEAKADLRRLRIPAVPAVVVGDRTVHGWNPKALAELVGVPYTEPTRLATAELSARLDRILAATARVMRQVPTEHLGLTHPGRDRSVRQLGYHVFRLALAFRDARVEGRLPQAWLQEEAPAALVDGPAVAGYGDDVRRRLAEWMAHADPVGGDVETYYGRQTAGELLERTVWHAAQHLRQLYDLLGRMGLQPDEPLAIEDWQGLPLPQEVW
jgi:DinB superfamily